MFSATLLTDGFKEYTTALLTHCGHWVQPPRRRAQGPAPKRRWVPRPQLLYAQVIKTVRRRRLVGVTHRVVFGTLGASGSVSKPWWWETATGGGLRWRRVPAQPASRTSSRGRGLLGRHNSTMVGALLPR